jgi:hypothetical protein
MNVNEFIAGRPCLEEIEGYLLGLRTQHKLGMDAPEIDADIIGPIEKYKALLLAGKETPYPSEMPREWEYRKGRKPQRKRRQMSERANDAAPKALDLNKRRKK